MKKFLIQKTPIPSTSAEGSGQKEENKVAKEEKGSESRNEDFPANDESESK